MKKVNYHHKLEKIKILELITYGELEENYARYKARVDFYQEKKDKIGTKIRMLEVYRNLWEEVETQMTEQAFLNEEFWHNISFSMLKYNKFIQELSEEDYDQKTKRAIDRKLSKEAWSEREQAFILMKNDINHLYTNFHKMHSEIHKRSLLQKECIEKHIAVMEQMVREADVDKEQYRNVFHEIRNDIGAKGNRFSKQALARYKTSILEKIENQDKEPEPIEFDLAW